MGSNSVGVFDLPFKWGSIFKWELAADSFLKRPHCSINDQIFLS